MKRFWTAAGTSAALCALFLVVYGSCNWITSLRAHVGSIYFAWERRIPFVPALILPYMSIDLFFIAAPFLARSNRERRTLALRIALAILIAGACFLLMPLKFAFERPPVDGVLGVIFNNFRSLDRPFNELPSLHIALWAILLDIYVRHTRGLTRWFVIIWFILIALSPLLTYQHHLVDILGGFVLAAICFHLVSSQPLRQPFMPNRHIGMYYLGGAILLAVCAFSWKPWSLALLWPMFSLLLVSAGYLSIGPGIYRKDAGRLPWTTWLLLWPALLGQRLSLLHYARGCQAYDRVTARLWIGRCLSASQARQVCAEGVSAVIDLTAEFTDPRCFRKLPYLHLSILDLTAPTPDQIEHAIAFIQRQSETGIVYLHCKIGYSRSAAIAGAYLLATHRADTAEQAIAMIRHARPSIIVRPEAIAAIQQFAARQQIPEAAGANRMSSAMKSQIGSR